MYSYETVINELNTELGQFDFECHPFKVDWYNENVDSRFQLDLPGDTLGVLVLNSPGMFEKLFLPYLFDNFKKTGKGQQPSDSRALSDPVDTCLSLKFEQVKEVTLLDQILLESFLKLEKKLNGDDQANIEIQAIKDFELDPRTRRAKIVMQTCAHISGAAYLYKASCLLDRVSEIKKKVLNLGINNLMGVCLHEKYGGWFAMRCVYLFKNLHVGATLIRKEPTDPLNNDFKRIFDTLKRFNDNWKDSTYRNTFPVTEKYSPIQQEYFNTVPNKRSQLISKWMTFKDSSELCAFYKSQQVYQDDYKQYLINNFYFV